MTLGKLDIHNSSKDLKASIQRLKDSSMSETQKKKILRLIEELQIGKASKKKVGNHRILSYITSWLRLQDYFKKDFDKITEKEAEQFYRNLDGNKIKKKNGQHYKDSSKQEFIKALKKYLGWSWEEIKYKKIIGWIKEYTEIPEQKAISLKEAESVVEIIPNLRDKTLFMFLVDSGNRIEEALNLKIKNIEKKQREKSEGEYYLVDIKFSKTLPRRISIPIASKLLTEWLKEHPDNKNPEAYLFPIGYDASRKMIKKYSKKALGFEITAHTLRHSSASLYCKKIDNPYKFCYRYGWKFGSKQANRYIDRNLLGEEEQEKLQNIIEGDRIQELEEELGKIKSLLKPILKKVYGRDVSFGYIKDGKVIKEA